MWDLWETPPLSPTLHSLKTSNFSLFQATLFESGEEEGSEEATKGSSVLPKAATSLKDLAELPIIVVFMYQVSWALQGWGSIGCHNLLKFDVQTL